MLNDPERLVEFEFVRATENAALNVLHWLGRGEKEKADAAACDAIYGVFDLVDVCAEVVIGEGSDVLDSNAGRSGIVTHAINVAFARLEAGIMHP